MTSPYFLPKCAKTYKGRTCHSTGNYGWQCTICQCLGNFPRSEMWKGLTWQTFHFDLWHNSKASHNDTREQIWHSPPQFLSPGHANSPSVSHNSHAHAIPCVRGKQRKSLCLFLPGTRYKISQADNQSLRTVHSRAWFLETALPCSFLLAPTLAVPIEVKDRENY